LPSELSIGEQQRVALARAICGGSSLLLADEPTGNLDSENSKRVLEHLTDFAKKGGAVLMVTHDHNAGNYAFSQIDMIDGKFTKEKHYHPIDGQM
jgi:putative ABC transport system ATP-binding protein